MAEQATETIDFRDKWFEVHELMDRRERTILALLERASRSLDELFDNGVDDVASAALDVDAAIKFIVSKDD